MSNNGIEKLLDLHNVQHYTNAGHIIATCPVYDTKTKTSYTLHEDLTGLPKESIYYFLGY